MSNNVAKWFAAAALILFLAVLLVLLGITWGTAAQVPLGAYLSEAADTVRLKMYVGDVQSFDSARTSVRDLSTVIDVDTGANTVFWYEGQWVAGDNPWTWVHLFIDKADTAYIPTLLPETAYAVRRVFVGDDTTYIDTTLSSVIDLGYTLVIPEGISYLRYDIQYLATDSPVTMAFPPFVVPFTGTAASATDTLTAVKFVLADISSDPITTARVTVSIRSEHDSILVSSSGVQVFQPMSVSSTADVLGEATITLYPNSIFTDSTYYIAEIRATDRRFEDRLLRWKFLVPSADTTVMFHLLDRWR